MDKSQETYPISPLPPMKVSLARELKESYHMTLAEFQPEILQKYKDSLETCFKYKKTLSKYAFWYLYNLCYNYYLVELLIRLDGETKFHFGDCFLSSHIKVENINLDYKKKRPLLLES